jgi:hypothetical protein
MKEANQGEVLGEALRLLRDNAVSLSMLPNFNLPLLAFACCCIAAS